MTTVFNFVLYPKIVKNNEINIAAQIFANLDFLQKPRKLMPAEINSFTVCKLLFN